MIAGLTSVALLAAGAVASPINVATMFEKRELGAYTSDVTIHESCNATQRRFLERALADTYEVASFAQEYVVKNGPQDPVFQLWFGNATDSYTKVLGVWESLLTSNKEGVLLRCDNPDGNCQFDGWRGHWRGENGTAETVICDASYTDRQFNTNFCAYGYELATTKPQLYWSIDLIHRLFHVPQITNGLVDHFADTVDEVIELAAHNGSYAAVDSNALQYFAANVYANEIAQGGDACIGTIEHGHHSESGDSHGHADASSSSAASAAPAATSAAAQDCHTHADGTLHCV